MVFTNDDYSSATYSSFMTAYSTFSHNVNKHYLGSIGDFRSSTLGLEKPRASIRRPPGPISLPLIRCLSLALVGQVLEPRSPNIPHRREQGGQLERVFSIKKLAGAPFSYNFVEWGANRKKSSLVILEPSENRSFDDINRGRLQDRREQLSPPRKFGENR